MIADMSWVKEEQPKDQKNLATKNPFTLHSPLFYHSPLKKFYSPWSEPFAGLRSTGLPTFHCFLTNGSSCHAAVLRETKKWLYELHIYFCSM